jgi:hypothetical protein
VYQVSGEQLESVSVDEALDSQDETFRSTCETEKALAPPSYTDINGPRADDMYSAAVSSPPASTTTTTTRLQNPE